MESRDFEFVTINTRSLWEQGVTDGLDITEEGIGTTGKRTHVLGKKFDTSSLGDILDDDYADFAIDSCGFFYVLDARKSGVRIYDPDMGCSELLEGVSKLHNPLAIAVNSAAIYIAETDGKAYWVRAIAKDNPACQREWSIGDARILDLAFDDQENLYVLAADRCVYMTNKERSLSNPYRTDMDSPLYMAFERDSLYILGTVDIKGRTYPKVGVYHITEAEDRLAVDNTIDLENPLGQFRPGGFAVDEEGNLYVSSGYNKEREADREMYIRKFSPSGEDVGVVSGFVGTCHRMKKDNHGNLYVLGRTAVAARQAGNAHREIISLELTRRYSTEGSYYSKALDRGEQGKRWHKITLDADIPKRTQIRVYCYISDNPLGPSDQDWEEIEPLIDPRDALILDSEGRYLWLKIQLYGNEQYTPKIRSVTAYFPRRSYLRYLPAIYQEDVASSDFLERFLSLFETFFANLESEISSITRYFDVMATPSYKDGLTASVVEDADGETASLQENDPETDFLTWLATWLAVVFDEDWEDKNKREFLKAVPELYRKRGTRAGLEEFIRIYLGRKPAIIEGAQLDYIKDKEVREYWAAFLGDCVYSFCVLLPPLCTKNQNQLNTVKRIVESEKPAHTTAGIRTLQPGIYLDMHTYMGFNSVLAEPVFRLDQAAAIGRNTILTDPESGERFKRMHQNWGGLV